MSHSGSTRRTTSLGGTSRLALSVGKASAPATATAGRHPLRHEWTISYMHRSPTVKVDYEKETKRVASFGSIETFLQLYTHLESPLDLQPVTDVLIFQARISKPGIWEVMPEGGRFTFRLQHGITPLLYESALFALIGDQFDEAERVVGIVLSVRQLECLISIWVEEEGEAVKSGALRDKLLNLLNLPSTTTCEYRSNKTMLEAAASKEKEPTTTGAAAGAGTIGSDGISGLPNGAGVNGTGNGYAAAPGGEREQRRTYHSNYNNHGHGHGQHGNNRGERYNSHRDNGDRDREHGDEDASAGRDGYTHGPGQGFSRGQSYRYNRDNRDNNRDARDRRDRDRPEDLTLGSEDASASISASASAGGANGGGKGSGAGAGAATVAERAERPAPLSARTSTGRFGQFSHTPLAAGSGPGFGRTDRTDRTERGERGERAERGAWVRPRAEL